jgi:hypothetical protein
MSPGCAEISATPETRAARVARDRRRVVIDLGQL